MKITTCFKWALLFALWFGLTPLHPSIAGNRALEKNSVSYAALKKVPKPKITAPKNKSQVSYATDIEGTAIPGNWVEIHVLLKYKGGQSDKGTHKVRVDEQGNWKLEDFQLWLPTEISKPKFIFKAVQIDGNGARSNSRKIKLIPKETILMIPNIDMALPPDKLAKARGGGEIIIRDGLDENLNEIPIPEIISPRDGVSLPKGEFVQFIGRGIPGNQIEIKGTLRYEAKNLYYLLDFERTAEVNEDGFWIIPKIDPNLVEKAEKVHYLFKVMQVSSEGLESNTVRVRVFLQD